MEVILLEKVANLGSLGDIVKVKDGFGRNYLIPQGKAKRATESNKAEFDSRRAELEKQQADILTVAKARAEKLTGQTIEIAQKAGEDGRLFGSVTNHDIADALKEKGFEVVKSEVRLPEGSLKEVGEFPVGIVLHHDTVVDITVNVVAEE
ncbi:MAG: 50S ribosomal protein L9 [Methylophilaceae bacterium]